MTLRLAPSERRQSIIEAAVPLFARKGSAGTTTREIADAAGVSEALVFKYFATKAALYEAMCERCQDVDPAFARLSRLLPGTTTLVEIVRGIVEHFAHMSGLPEHHPARQRMFLRSLSEDGEFARAALRAFADTVLPLFRESYEAAAAVGDLVSDRPEPTTAFWLMVQGPLMVGSIALAEATDSVLRVTAAELERAALRAIGLRDFAVARHARAVPNDEARPPAARAAMG